jgi:3-dehydroquinate dehydratase type I
MLGPPKVRRRAFKDMTALKPVKKGRGDGSYRTVGVITSPAGLREAIAMRVPPDLFELRLDHLVRGGKTLQQQMPSLASPLIVTARAPLEGGANSLSATERRDLLLRYVERVAFVDVELRSTRALAGVLVAADRIGVHKILSFHDLARGPIARVLQTKLEAAQRLNAEVLKIVVRTDTMDDISRLAEFTARAKRVCEVSVMGVGRLGLVSRVMLAEVGSKFVYGAIGQRRVSGQPSLVELRCALAASAARIN